RSRDKAELKNRTRQLLTSQRMELMGTMAAGTVHDLKNLLSIIMAYSGVISGIFDKDDENRKHVEVIKETTGTAMHMAKQILKFSRIKTGDTGEQDLVVLLDDIIRTLDVTRPRSVHIHWEPPSERYTYHIHPVRFQQLVMNLSLNAIHAMPRGGDLTVSLSHGMNRETLLKISDTGTGIDPGDITKIFRPLYTTKTQDKGTGLGLFVVKQILEEYKGKIELDSEPGKGTTFTLVFPWQEKTVGSQQ
ncbi:MAG: HAMP domain-containing histidine kinase, partial [bacterium]|nr:HAMP domain-containing histidine kinase [bacterium]